MDASVEAQDERGEVASGAIAETSADLTFSNDTTPLNLSTKSARFGAAGVGDCQLQEGSTLVFRSDGWAYFDGFVRSSDTGDNFRLGFHVLDSAGNGVFSQPRLGAFQRKCNDDHSWTPWHIDFQFSPIYYDRITAVRMWFNDCSG
jgi:hypothetical protein